MYDLVLKCVPQIIHINFTGQMSSIFKQEQFSILDVNENSSAFITVLLFSQIFIKLCINIFFNNEFQ